MPERGNFYHSLNAYNLIGDSHSAALVADDGSVDWCCLPDFDSPAVFCRLLDSERGGFFRIGPPAGTYESSSRYRGSTNVLQTTFQTANGSCQLTDFMPVNRPRSIRLREDLGTNHTILRLLEAVGGYCDIEIVFKPTFDYAREETTISLCEDGAIATNNSDWLRFYSPVQLRIDQHGRAIGQFRLSGSDRVWFCLTYSKYRSNQRPILNPDNQLAVTLEYWHRWSNSCIYDGPYHDLVKRSALVLKLLTYEPTGALVAAPTTSLPEEIGGVRNWDYRFTWLRDSALTIYALQLLGYRDEATDFFNWLDRLQLAAHRDIQIIYTIRGESDLPEHYLEHLSGYRDSQPVRIGNAAANQRQIDLFGHVLDAVHLYHEQIEHPVRANWWDEVDLMADQAAARWREPDRGIWEIRRDEQHHFYSKLMCWVALDRALKLGRLSQRSDKTAKWAKVRDEVRNALLRDGYNATIGAFTQSLGGITLDAAALVIPFTGFLPARDPRVLSTIDAIRERLTSNGLVYRYLNDDGLPGQEATFAMCTFWLADCLALSGRTDEAREVFERVVSYASSTGLLSEEIDPVSGELLGNYPQGFTHLALIRTAIHIGKSEARGAELQTADSAQRAKEVEDFERAHGD